MIDAQSFILIDGEFKQEDARSNLFDLLLKRIQYHGIESFSSRIRFGDYDPEHEKRKRQLEDTLEILKTQFASAEKNNQRLKITAEVQISLVE